MDTAAPVGGGGFLSYSASPDLKLGFAFTGNFGAPLEYDDNWVGRYYVQETTVLGLSFLPSIAYKVTDKLSLGASVNAMYGIYKNRVAINNVAPGFGDGQLELDDNTWGWGLNLGLLYEFTPSTRVGFTWSSEVASTSMPRSSSRVSLRVSTRRSRMRGCSMPPSTWGSKSRSRRC